MTNSPILPFHNAFVVCITHNVSLPPIYHDFLHHLKDYRALLDFTIMTICHTTISFFPVQGSLLINFWMWPALTVASMSKGFRSPVKKNKPQFWISWSLSNSLSVASEIMFFTALNPRLGLYFEFLSDFYLLVVGPEELLNINVYIAPFPPDRSADLWFSPNIEVFPLFFQFLFFPITFISFIVLWLFSMWVYILTHNRSMNIGFV